MLHFHTRWALSIDVRLYNMPIHPLCKSLDVVCLCGQNAAETGYRLTNELGGTHKEWQGFLQGLSCLTSG